MKPDDTLNVFVLMLPLARERQLNESSFSQNKADITPYNL
jgi:hypothetical protein